MCITFVDNPGKIIVRNYTFLEKLVNAVYFVYFLTMTGIDLNIEVVIKHRRSRMIFDDHEYQNITMVQVQPIFLTYFDLLCSYIQYISIYREYEKKILK